MLRIQVTTVPAAQSLLSQIDLSNKASAVIDINNYLTSLPSTNRGVLVATINPVQAFGLVTFTGAVTAAETLVIAGVTFTARASGATGNEFNLNSDVTIEAANLAAAVNASPNLANIVTATSAAGVVTLTAVLAGVMGNGLILTEALSNATVTAFASGAEGSTLTSINLY